MTVFADYAQYYDLLYQDKDYQSEADFIYQQIQQYSSCAQNVLDLGCGSGIHAQLLAEKGLAVHGVDMSETMLSHAWQRHKTLSFDLQQRLWFEQGDVRNVRTGKTYDAVTALFHVISYQTRNQDLHAAFETAATLLNKQGIFIFDYWYGPAVLTQKPECRIKRLSNAGLTILRIAEPVLDTQKNTVLVRYETQVQTVDSRNMIYEEHQMRYLFLPEVEELAKQHGFVLEKHAVWMKDDAPSANAWSVFTVLRKQ